MTNINWIFFDVGSTLIDETECYNHRIRDAIDGTAITFEQFNEKCIFFAKQNLKGDIEALKFFGLIKATPHKDRLTALYASCLLIFRHITQKLLEIRQYSCVVFRQSDEKSDCAICIQSSCGVALIELAENNDIISLQAASKKGYKPNSEVLKTAVLHASSDTVKLILDNGAEMPDDIMEDARYASKATVKVLIAAGANTDLKFDELQPADGGGVVQKGDFDLKDYYKHYGRDDLAELL